MRWPKFLIKEVVVEVEKKYSPEELASMLAESLGDINTLSIPDEKEEAKIYKELNAVEGIIDILRDTMVKDIRRYFAAQTEKERDIIRGAFSRTAHWMTKILDKEST